MSKKEGTPGGNILKIKNKKKYKKIIDFLLRKYNPYDDKDMTSK